MQQGKTSLSRKMTRAATAVLGAVALATLAACASQPVDTPPVVSSRPYGPAYPPPASYVEYGRVSAVEVIRTEEKRKSSGAGAIIGGIAGAVVGNQIGGGSGRALATAAGAVGGAVVGNNVGSRGTDVSETYRISVQVENGTARAYDVPSPGDLRVGDRVRIQDGRISRV
jgi:outer membrane lipoprotein SlyB